MTTVTRWIMILGLLVVIIPPLGFPRTWEMIALIVIGVLIILYTWFLHLRFKHLTFVQDDSSTNDTAPHEQKPAPFVDNRDQVASKQSLQTSQEAMPKKEVTVTPSADNTKKSTKTTKRKVGVSAKKSTEDNKTEQ